MALHFCHCIQRFWSNHCQVRYVVQCQTAGWYFISCTKQVTVFVSPISFVGKRLTLTAFKRIFSQRYYMVTQLTAYFSIFNTTTQLVASKFFDKSLYGDIAHRSHIETINEMILWHKTTKHFNSEAQTVINHYLYLWKYTGLHSFLQYNPVTVCF